MDSNQQRSHPALARPPACAAASTVIAPQAHSAGVTKKQSKKKRAPPPPSLNLGLQSFNQFAGECPVAFDVVVIVDLYGWGYKVVLRRRRR